MRDSKPDLRYALGERDAAKDRERSDYILSAPVNRRGQLGRNLSRHLLTRTAVYAIGLVAGSPIKIGFSRRPVGRLVELQLSSPRELRFHLVCWVADKKEAVALEQRCHQRLRAEGRHLRGEWFDLTPLEVAKAIDGASIDVGCHMAPHKELVRMFPSSKDPLAGYFWS